MVAELTPDYPSQYAAITAVAQELGIGTVETLRKWVRRAEVNAGERPGTTLADAQRAECSVRYGIEGRRSDHDHRA
jgi:transposase